MYEGKDTFVSLLMGIEESLCYQIVPFIFNHKLGVTGPGKSSTSLVVSLLVSLIVDQAQRLRNQGAKASI